ncbi:engulfment and cell motility protein 3 isoform X7 [Neomonachus schauinslandi]|uniref:Engulfment and cell motility protein 3 isoform X7 n=1 Tax=Neomonachus schauinslandi TaxID=29088 RepID=A0A2Y9I730_NEOSC|nr:engulfment and cell motility protein 3 isoform X7 [Neomonachus schauinslandi]
MAPPRNVVKIAVQMPDAIPQLIQLDQAKPLAAVLKEVCDAWSLVHSERYALQFADGHRSYITENNRTEIKNGSILCLSTAPDLEAERLLGGLQSGSRERRREALQHLVLLAPDVTFAQEVISRDGLQRLGTIVEDGDDLGEVLTLALRAFLELMEHGMVSWETLSIPFVRKVVCYVNMNLMDASVQPLALRLLESVTLSSPALGQLVKSEVPLDRLLVHLQVMNQQLQTKAMALLTALLQGANPAERKHMLGYLWQRNLRQFIYKNIIHSATPLGDEMAHHLYVLQALMLGLLEPRMRTPLDPYSQEQREQLQALRQAAFESEGESLGTGLSADRRRSLCAREFRKLGFSNSNPAQDLERVPPGLLALDNMLYFSRHAPSAYSRLVLENSSREDKHECPFARSSIQLTVLLCELLRIGEPCSETAQDFSPMFFGQDQSFHELFCVSIQLLNKTWKEMRATQEDFDKNWVAPGHAGGAGAAGPYAGPEAQLPGAFPNQGECASLWGGAAAEADRAAASGGHAGPSHTVSCWEWVPVLAPPAPVPHGPCPRSVPVSKPSPCPLRPPTQGATGKAEARAHGPDPPAAFAPPLRGDTLPQNQQPEAPGQAVVLLPVPQPQGAAVRGRGGGRQPTHPGEPA